MINNKPIKNLNEKKYNKNRTNTQLNLYIILSNPLYTPLNTNERK